MAFGNNRAVARKRSIFQQAGGSIVKYRHPLLSGQISQGTPVDEVDISKTFKLNSQYLNARSLQDNAVMEVMVDGGTITITNNMLAGQMDVEVVRGSGLVGDGDFIAAAHLVISTGDDVGGTVTQIEMINGKRIVTVWYGVAFKNVPHMIKAGNAVPSWPVQMLYSGWIQGVGGGAQAVEKTVWAVGNQYGLKGVYKPYGIQSAENPSDPFGGRPLGAIGGVGANASDDSSVDFPNLAPTATPAGGYPSMDPSGSDPNPTW